jgi:hypothetical protein
VRHICVILLLLVGLGWVAAEIPLHDSDPSAALPTWRRTVDGWERPHWLSHESPCVRPMHPAAVGTTELMLALGALIAFSSGRCVPVSRSPRPDAADTAGGLTS